MQLVPVQSPAAGKPDRAEPGVDARKARSESTPGACLHEQFEQQAALTPDATALVCGNVRLSYRELDEKANQAAHYLRKLGVRPDVLVGVCIQRRVEMIIGLLATLKAGGAYVPLDATYPKQRLDGMLNDVAMAVLLTTEDLLPGLPEVRSQLVVLDSDWPRIAAESPAKVGHLPATSDLAYVIFTSGSTGKAKAAGVHHGGWSNLLGWFDTEFEVTAADKVLVISSFSFDITQRSIMMPLIVGGELHLLASPYYDPGLILHTISSERITLMNCAPSTFYPLIEKGTLAATLKLASLRIVFLGGEAISASRLRAWAESNDCRTEAVNVYGVAECSDVSSYHRLRDYKEYVSKSVPLGKPIWNSRVYLLNDDLQPAAPGETGEICLAGVGVGRGYVNDAELTAQKFVKNPFSDTPGSVLYRTGDVGRELPDGSLQYRGRVDNQIKIRGVRIELGDIESALRHSPLVSEAVVITRTYDAGDERLVACVVPQKKLGREELSPRLRTFLREKLPAHMVPSEYVLVDELPLTPNGKVDRAALRALTAEVSTVGVGLEPPRNPLEERVAGIFARVLKLDRVGIFDSFFDLGGTSYLVTEVLSEFIENGVADVSILDFLSGPTVAQVAAVAANAETESSSEEREEREEL